jgi:hypothetical protein
VAGIIVALVAGIVDVVEIGTAAPFSVSAGEMYGTSPARRITLAGEGVRGRRVPNPGQWLRSRAPILSAACPASSPV